MSFSSRALFFLLLIVSLPSVALAAPGEYKAVIQSCGEPTATNQTTSPVDGEERRDLIYNDLILHFEPMQGGWSFTTAWQDHMPYSRAGLAARAPCFRQALQQVAATNPATKLEEKTPADATTAFGVPFFWFIALLILALPLAFAKPAARPSKRPYLHIKDRPFRKPGIPSFQ